MRIVSGIVTLVYILVGVLIANNNDYFRNVNELEEIVSAILAVVLWPLVLLGIDLQLGEAGENGRAGSILVAPGMPARASRRREAGPQVSHAGEAANLMLEPTHQDADIPGMETWDAWEAEIQERLAELTDEQPDPVRRRSWMSVVRLWFGLSKA